MKLEPGDLLVVETGIQRGETRVVIAVQPYAGIPETKETEALLMYPNGALRWHSSRWLARITKKAGDNESR